MTQPRAYKTNRRTFHDFQNQTGQSMSPRQREQSQSPTSKSKMNIVVSEIFPFS